MPNTLPSKPRLPLRLALALAMGALALAGCSTTAQPSHGASNTPSGVSVYGTIDVGVGKGGMR